MAAQKITAQGGSWVACHCTLHSCGAAAVDLAVRRCFRGLGTTIQSYAWSDLDRGIVAFDALR
jgi:hypothetical protein